MDVRAALMAVRRGFMRRWEFDGNPRNLLIGALSAAAITLVFVAIREWRILDIVPYGPWMTLLVGVVSNRLGMRSGLVCAGVGIFCLEVFFYGEGFTTTWPITIQISSYSCMVGAAIFLARPRADHAGRIIDRGQDLPFTRRREDGNGGLHGIGSIYWDAPATGNWFDDAHVGSEYLRILAHRVEGGERAPMLPWIIHDMIRAGRWSGVEAGFASALEKLAFRRARPDRPAEPPPQSGA